MRTATKIREPVSSERPIARLTLLSLGGDMLTFLIATLAFFFVRIVGQLYISEIILLAFLPIFIILHPKRVFRPGLRAIFALMGLWFISQVLTDIYRRTEIQDWMRGDSTIIFFAVDLLSLSILLGNSQRRRIIFIAGLAIGSMIGSKFEPVFDYSADPWKWIYSMGTSLAILLVSCYFYRSRRYFITGLLLAGIAAVNLVMNFRSPVLMFLVTMVLVLPIVPERIGRLRLLPRAGSVARLAVLAGLALGAAGAAAGLVHVATSAGWLSEEAQAKNEIQSQSKGGLLLSGRPEIYVSSKAVWDSPILGHGSWAKDFKYTEMLYDIGNKNGFESDDLQEVEDSSQGLIPTHSHLMGAWVQAGVLGAVFWAYILWLVFKGLVRVLIARPALTPLYTWMFIDLLWSIPFSPFANTGRVSEALMIVIIVDLLESSPPAVGALRQPRRKQWRRTPFRQSLSSQMNQGIFPS
jgi:O-antigen ligase